MGAEGSEVRGHQGYPGLVTVSSQKPLCQPDGFRARCVDVVGFNAAPRRERDKLYVGCALSDVL